MITHGTFPVCHGQSLDNQFMTRGLDFFVESYVDEIVGDSVFSDVDGISLMGNVDGDSVVSNIDGHSLMSNIDGDSPVKEDIKNYAN